MRHEPHPDEIPDSWPDKVVDLEDVAALDHHPEIDDACLRLLREVAYRSQNEAGCCWQGRERFLERFGWWPKTLDLHRRHLREELKGGVLAEVPRRPRTTLRRLDPEKIRELAEEARANRNAGENPSLTTGDSPSLKTGDSPSLTTGDSRSLNTGDSPSRGAEGGEEEGEEGEAASRAPAPEGPSPPGEDAGDPSPERVGAARRDGDRPEKWHRTLGKDPETGLEVRAGRNQRAPYVARIDPSPGHARSRWEDLPDGTTDERLEAVTLEEALEILAGEPGEAEKQRGRFKRGAGPRRMEREDHLQQVREKIEVIDG